MRELTETERAELAEKTPHYLALVDIFKHIETAWEDVQKAYFLLEHGKREEGLFMLYRIHKLIQLEPQYKTLFAEYLDESGNWSSNFEKNV